MFKGIEIQRGANLITGYNPISSGPVYTLENFQRTGLTSHNQIEEYYELKTTLTGGPITFVYVLPVESGNNSSFGNGIEEIKKIMDAGDIEDDTVFIYPVYDSNPWYADHPTNFFAQQESNLVTTLPVNGSIPEQPNLMDEIIARYSAYTIDKTYALGYSKSGNGCVSLLMNHPNRFDGVAVWDPPLGSTDFTPDALMGGTFGSLQNYQDNWALIGRLPSQNTNLVGKQIHIGGYNLWQPESDAFVTALSAYTDVTFTEDDTVTYDHVWHEGWMRIMLTKFGGIIN